MNIKKHIPTFARWFSLNPQPSAVDELIETIRNNAEGLYRVEISTETPAIAKETPRKRCTYIPTNESPWCVLRYSYGKWILGFHELFDTREQARDEAKQLAENLNCKTRVVRLIVPTR